MSRTRSVRTQTELLSFVIATAAVRDAQVLREAAVLQRIAPPEDWETIGLVGDVVVALRDGFDYLSSPEFTKSTEGKSDSVRAMKARLLSEPVRRLELCRRFDDALLRALQDDAVLQLLPEYKHPLVRQLRSLMARLSLPTTVSELDS